MSYGFSIVVMTPSEILQSACWDTNLRSSYPPSNEDLAQLLSIVLQTYDPVSAYGIAIKPILTEWNAPWAALLRLNEDGNLVCAFSTDESLIGRIQSVEMPVTNLFGSAIRPDMVEHDAASSIFRSLTDGHCRTSIAYLTIAHGKERFLILLAGLEGGKPFRIETCQATMAGSLLASARIMEMLHQSRRERTELEQRLAELQARQDELHLKASHDDLTGLPNRSFTRTLVEKRLSHRGLEGRLALAFIDLDDFKRVNDTYGHSVGDELLRNVAERLRAGTRDSDICGRIGGDEFVICIDDPHRPIDAAAIFSRISELVGRPFEIENQSISCSASIGVALYPQQGTTFEALLRAADTAMYRAKKRGKGGLSIGE